MTMSRGSMRPLPVCADCCAPEPTWASINRGVLICDECCSVHLSLGRHISQVKHLKRGQWSPSQHAMVYILASNGANNIWEHTMLDPAQNKHGRRKPGPRDPLHPNKSDFIRSKYQHLAFVNKQKDSDASSLDDVSRELHSSVRTNNVETCLRLLSKGADPNYFHREKGNSPIHVAAQEGQTAQVELLCVYGADPGARDIKGQTPYDYAKKGFPDLADRLIELQYELTDRLTFYLCARKPDHRTGVHFKIPEFSDNNADLSELARQAKKKLQALANHLFEELAVDVYDEVDRRENDAVWLSSHDPTSVLSEGLTVPHLPVNPELSTTRNQGRQKLARFNAREFATLVVDILYDARRRQTGITSSPVHAPMYPDRMGRNSQRMSTISDEEPLYDSVASDEDYSSIDTQSIRSAREEMRPDITAESMSEQQVEAPVSSEEFQEIRKQLAASEATIKHLVQAKRDLEKKVDSLMRENANLRVISHDFSPMLMNGIDSGEQPDTDHRNNNNNEDTTTSDHGHEDGRDGDIPKSPSLRSGGARPISMIEMRDQNRQQLMHGGAGSNAQMMSSTSVTNIAMTGTGQSKGKGPSGTGNVAGDDQSRESGGEGHYDIPKSNQSAESGHGANEGQVQEVLSSIRESSESEQGSNSSLAQYNDDPNMPTQEEVVKKTEKVTKKIQELLVAAQEGRHNSFESCSERIYTAVSEMASLFPDETGSERLQNARVVLEQSARRLRDECKSWPPSPEQDANPDFRVKSQQVIQHAYDIAKAAKRLVTLFQ